MQSSATKRRRRRHKAGLRLYQPKTFNARSRQRFVAARVASFIAHLGGKASITQQILVHRAIAKEWRLLQLDHRLDACEELSEHALHERMAAEQRLRLDLQALGFEAIEKVETINQHLARLARKQSRRAAREAAARRLREAPEPLEASARLITAAEGAPASTAFLAACEAVPMPEELLDE